MLEDSQFLSPTFRFRRVCPLCFVENGDLEALYAQVDMRNFVVELEALFSNEVYEQNFYFWGRALLHFKGVRWPCKIAN